MWNYAESYEGFEKLDNFSASQLKNYREMLIRKTEHQVSFIEDTIMKPLGRSRINVLELCCGNGRLLIDLASKGLLVRGVGIDISRSRVDFACQWKDEAKLPTPLVFFQADVLKTELPANARGSFDLVVCITGAFQYFAPVSEDAPAKVLALMNSSLCPEGGILMELYTPSFTLSSSFKTWKELEPNDLWSYYLSEYSYRKGNLMHSKTFIKRSDSTVSKSCEVLRIYRSQDLCDMLCNAGFVQPEFKADDSEQSESFMKQSFLVAWKEGTNGR